MVYILCQIHVYRKIGKIEITRTLQNNNYFFTKSLLLDSLDIEENYTIISKKESPDGTYCCIFIGRKIEIRRIILHCIDC
ncbi:hypothetical protein RCL_jg24585.t1 [Rhizophagus clarus]|uniref:Uncharacterized protein n=1 Tax=Rhizophagus clarus TaxID=94130 RepID=A0A8H3MGB5_9GLOM|nr:hypothetical protein RCL_jg24585.t1 [Rhizophagus clarus]